MAFEISPTPGDPGEPDARSASAEASGQAIRPSLAREGGVQVLAHGALICPSCSVPVVIDRPMPAGRHVSCGACGTQSRARELVVPDVFDTVSNEVYLVGRVPRAPRALSRRWRRRRP